MSLSNDILLAVASKAVDEKRHKSPDITRGYVIGTGWWCDETKKHAGTQFNESTSLIRTRDFFRVWHSCVDKYTNPRKIIVVDSNSPVLPNMPDDKRIEFLSLDQNFGHYVECDPARMCGVERAHLACALYAYLNDCDLVYIEQDCLVLGDHWVEACYRAWNKQKIMYGPGKGTPQPQQQSLVLVSRQFIPIFLVRLLNLFFQAREKLIAGQQRNPLNPENRWHAAFRRDVDYLPFGSGRARPIPFNEPHFYAQHWTEEELEKALGYLTNEAYRTGVCKDS